MALPKIKDYDPVRVFHGKGFEIGLYKKEDEYIMYRHAARGKVKKKRHLLFRHRSIKKN